LNRLRRFRELREADPRRLAQELGISTAWYYDLERKQPNWADEISVCGLRQLSRLLDISPSSLFRDGREPIPTATAFITQLSAYLENKGMSAGELSAVLGWDVERIINDPAEVYKLNASGFRAICDQLDLDWLVVLDEMAATKAKL
jgi:transcriptional regulator with XRE-family HTH domain